MAGIAGTCVAEETAVTPVPGGGLTMDLHISLSKMGSHSVVKVDGALTREGLAELERVVSPCVGALRLDLSELRSLDADGLEAIQVLGGGGAEIVGASPYIALLIGTDAGVPGTAWKRRKKEKTQ